MYDFDKLVLFCILYCDADQNIKAQMLFYLMASDDDLIMSKGSKVKHIFSYLTVIACVITAEFIHSVSAPFKSFCPLDTLFAAFFLLKF